MPNKFTGTTGCIKLSRDTESVGLLRSKALQTTCSIFSDEDCKVEVQSVGVRKGQIYGCTNFNAAARVGVASARCYFNIHG